MSFRFIAMAALSVLVLAACGSASERSAEYLERAREYIAEEDYVKAKLDLRNAIKIDPENVEARMLLVDAAERDRNFRVMFNQLSRVLAIEPDNVDAHVRIGGVLLLGAGTATPGVLEDIEGHIQSALELDPQNVDARVLDGTLMLQRGLGLIRAGDEEEGRALIESAYDRARQVLSTHPENVAGVALLTRLYLQDEDTEAALVTLNQGIQAAPESSVLYLQRIELLLRLQRWDAAELALLELRDRFPEEKGVQYRLVGFYTGRSRFEDAEAILQSMVEQYPDDTTAKLQYAQFLANNRDPEVAESTLKGYAAGNPEIYEFRFALATLYEAMARRSDAATDQSAALSDAVAVYEGIIEETQTGDDAILARTSLAKLELQRGDVDAARELIEQVLSEAPSEVEALILRGGIRIDEGQTDDAIADLRTAYRNDPESERALALLAQAHLRAGDVNLAEERLRDLLELAPANVFARDRLAAILVNRGQSDEALEILEASVESNPSAEGIALLVDALTRQGRYDDAREAAAPLLASEQRKAAGHYLVGRVYQAENRHEEAVASFEEAVLASGATPDVLAALTNSLSSLGRPGEALPVIDAWREANPERHEGYTLAGQVYARLQRWDEARAAMEASLARDDTRWPVYRDLAGIELASGNPTAARAALQRGIDVLPENPQLRILLAQVYESQGEFVAAISQYEEVVRISPDADVAANNLAALIADHDQAPDRLQYALELTERLRQSQNPIYIDTVGWVNYRVGNIPEAVSLLERAVSTASKISQLQAQLPQLRYHLGMAYLRADQIDDARRELQAAVEGGAQRDFIGLDEARATLAQL
jgi:tetratricopeptide (TPR) repeat protein